MSQIRLMTNPRAGSYNLLANIPTDGIKNGPWKFWKEEISPIFVSGKIYQDEDFLVYEGHESLSTRPQSPLAAAEMNEIYWAVSNGGTYRAAGTWHVFNQCETLGFASNCFLQEDNTVTFGALTWLKATRKAAGFNPEFGRPFSAQGGFQELNPLIDAGVAGDWSDWYINPSKIDDGGWTDGEIVDGKVSGTAERWIWYQNQKDDQTIEWGPFDTKFLCALCWRKVGTRKLGYTWAVYPMYWSTGTAPEGFDPSILGVRMNAAGFPQNRFFDLRIHAVVKYVKPAANANIVNPTQPPLPTRPNWRDDLIPQNLYYNTHFFMTSRTVANIRTCFPDG